MLLRLDKCVGEVIGYVELATAFPTVRLANGTTIAASMSAAGFPVDRSPKALAIDPTCTVKTSTSYEWLHDCATLPGNSGSPIFRKVHTEGQVRLQVLAVVTSGAHWREAVPYAGRYANRAIPMAQLIERIGRAVNADKCC